VSALFRASIRAFTPVFAGYARCPLSLKARCRLGMHSALNKATFQVARIINAIDARGLATGALDQRVKLGGINDFHAATKKAEVISF
jgi:hypothetical protein